MKRFIIVCLMAFVVCSCNFEQKRHERERARFVADSLAKRELFVADSIARLPIKSQLLMTYGEKIVAKYESYTTYYNIDYNGNRKYATYNHYTNRDKAFFYCEQLKKVEDYIDFSIKAKHINELDYIDDITDIVFLQKTYRLYAKYGYDGVFAINEWQPIDEVEKLINKQWDNRPYGQGGDSDFIKSIVNKYY